MYIIYYILLLQYILDSSAGKFLNLVLQYCANIMRTQFNQLFCPGKILSKLVQLRVTLPSYLKFEEMKFVFSKLSITLIVLLLLHFNGIRKAVRGLAEWDVLCCHLGTFRSSNSSEGCEVAICSLGGVYCITECHR